MTHTNQADLGIKQLQTIDNWFELFSLWNKEAEAAEIDNHNAVALATADATGFPNVRMVLVKEVTQQYLIFYTNYNSTKAKELLANPRAALCFHWKSLKRQVRIKGLVETTDSSTADNYFRSRDYLSQVGAWASAQSSVLENREIFEKNLEIYKNKYPENTEVPRPPHWSGFKIMPLTVEFWQDRASRLHDRLLFQRSDIDSLDWDKQFLYP